MLLVQGMGFYCITTLKFGCTVNKTSIVVAFAGHGILLCYHIEVRLYCKQNIHYSCFCRAWDLTVLSH